MKISPNYTHYDRTAPRYVKRLSEHGFVVVYDLQLRAGETLDQKQSHVVCSCNTYGRALRRAEQANKRRGIDNKHLRSLSEI